MPERGSSLKLEEFYTQLANMREGEGNEGSGEQDVYSLMEFLHSIIRDVRRPSPTIEN